MILLAGLCLSYGCEEEIQTQENPEIQLLKNSVAVPGDGGTVDIGYRILNPVAGGELSAVPSADWMHDFTQVNDTLMTFSADPNDSGMERTGSITLSYRYGDDKSVTAELDVTQSMAGAEPVITLATPDVVPATGGEIILAYEIADPVEGGVVSASSEASWIEDITCPQDGTVHMTVLANDGEERETTLTVTYAYDGKEVEASVTLVQEAAAPGEEYDYEYEFTIMSGEYYGATGYNGEYNFYTVISDIPLDESGNMPNGGIYYWFDIYTPKPEDPSNPLPPAGTYALGSATDEMTFSMDFSAVIQIDDQGEYTYQGYYVEGEMTISYEGDNMIIEAFMTDESDYTHHVTFRGKAGFTNLAEDEEDDGIVKNDIHIDAGVAVAAYVSGDSYTMRVQIQMTDMTVDASGYVYPPGSLLTIDAYVPFNEDGKMADGKYTVEYSGYDFTCTPGSYFVDYTGTYVKEYDEYNNGRYGLVSDGSMTVSHSGGNTVIECVFYTEEGYNVTASWSGEMQVGNMPGPFSTLTGDYELDLEGAVATAYNYGDYYMTGGNNWALTLDPVGGPDGFQVEFVSVEGDFLAGIPSGTYYPSAADAYPVPGEYIPGYMSGSSLYGTIYFGGLTSDGYVTEFAPAISGPMTITNNGDGTYRIEMDFMDDKGNNWTGEWEGTIDMQDWSYAPQPSGRTNVARKSNVPETLVIPSYKMTGRK